MAEEMTPQELLRPNDPSLQDDRLPEHERLARLTERMGSFDIAQAFDVCARDVTFRGLMEWDHNGSVPL